jgi:hypothetical protein
VSATGDPIEPPPSVRALLDVVGSQDRRDLEVPGGHLALARGSEASGHLWPAIVAWLAARS